MARPGPVGGQYQPLTEAQIKQIHQASLTVLERPGLLVENEEALALYQQGGARVDGHRVYITPAMVEEALEKAPSKVLLAGRDPDQDVVLEGKRVCAGTGGSPTMVLDPGADTVRPGTVQVMRSELFYPPLADRRNRAMWGAAGKQDTRARAIARVEKLLQEHQASGPPSEVDAAVRAGFSILL